MTVGYEIKIYNKDNKVVIDTDENVTMAFVKKDSGTLSWSSGTTLIGSSFSAAGDSSHYQSSSGIYTYSYRAKPYPNYSAGGQILPGDFLLVHIPVSGFIGRFFRPSYVSTIDNSPHLASTIPTSETLKWEIIAATSYKDNMTTYQSEVWNGVYGLNLYNSSGPDTAGAGGVDSGANLMFSSVNHYAMQIVATGLWTDLSTYTFTGEIHETTVTIDSTDDHYVLIPGTACYTGSDFLGNYAWKIGYEFLYDYGTSTLEKIKVQMLRQYQLGTKQSWGTSSSPFGGAPAPWMIVKTRS